MKLLCLIVFFAGLCHSVSKATECAAQGRFPNDDAEDCQGYTMCLLGGARGFTQYKLKCPDSFAYSHTEHQCTNATNYQCMPSYVCSTIGNFENPFSKNCSSYIACPKGMSGVVSARQVECPMGDVFSPEAAACVSTGYVCGGDVTTKAFTEIPAAIPHTEVIMTIPHTEAPVTNSTTNVQVPGEDGFQLPSSVSLNSAVHVCSTRVLFTLMVFVYVIN